MNEQQLQQHDRRSTETRMRSPVLLLSTAKTLQGCRSPSATFKRSMPSCRAPEQWAENKNARCLLVGTIVQLGRCS